MFSVWWLFSSNSPTTINCACFTWLTMQSVAKGRSLQTSTDQGKKLRQVVCSEARDWTIRQTPKAITGLQIKTHKRKITNSESSIHYSQPKFTNLTNFRKMLEKSIRQQIICLLRRPGEEKCNIAASEYPLVTSAIPRIAIPTFHTSSISLCFQ